VYLVVNGSGFLIAYEACLQHWILQCTLISSFRHLKPNDSAYGLSSIISDLVFACIKSSDHTHDDRHVNTSSDTDNEGSSAACEESLIPEIASNSYQPNSFIGYLRLMVLEIAHLTVAT
jgi:hypothetical protein